MFTLEQENKKMHKITPEMSYRHRNITKMHNMMKYFSDDLHKSNLLFRVFI